VLSHAVVLITRALLAPSRLRMWRSRR
jgi:hypothetical protein